MRFKGRWHSVPTNRRSNRIAVVDAQFTTHQAINIVSPLVGVDAADVCMFAVVVYRHSDHKPLVASPMGVLDTARFLARTAVHIGEEGL